MIPLNDLGRQTEAQRADIRAAIDGVLTSGWFVLGPEVAAFEREFAAYCGVNHCIGVANGTDALELALLALEIGPGCKVATVANAGMYATGAILAVGAQPVFVDIDEDSMTMDPAALERSLLDTAPRAVVITHLYGQLAAIEQLTDICRRHGVAVIEDCAQAHGARRNGRVAGSWGDVSCFSFFPTKNLGALGDGGAVASQSEMIATRLRALRQYGWAEKYHAVVPRGRNSRLDEMQAAVLRLRLRDLDNGNRCRRTIMQRFQQASAASVHFPDVSGEDHVAHLCVVQFAERDRLKCHLQQDGIATTIHYPVPDYRQPALLKTLTTRPSLPATERCVGRILTLPCFPEMTEDEISRVCSSLARFAERNGVLPAQHPPSA